MDQSELLPPSTVIGRCTVSFVSVLVTQSVLFLVPSFLSTSSLVAQLILSAVGLLAVMCLGKWFRRLLGLRPSVPAFVFFNLLFVWGVYIAIVREAISNFMDVVFNGEVVMLIVGLYSILSRDPGRVTNGLPRSDVLMESSICRDEVQDEELEPSSKGIYHENLTGSSLLAQRVRYCKTCKAYIRGFDHHCPAFGNCIGQNNYILFVALLVGFLTTEASYVLFSFQFARTSHVLDGTRLETDLAGNLVISTMLFSILQVLWQGVFLTWHFYCVCCNIRTDEWINWKKYPEFQLIQSQPGESISSTMFRNPYDKGILQNLREFLAPSL